MFFWHKRDYIFVKMYLQYQIINLHELLQACNPKNLRFRLLLNYAFENRDITDENQINSLFIKYNSYGDVNTDTKSNVDRFMNNSIAFVKPI